MYVFIYRELYNVDVAALKSPHNMICRLYSTITARLNFLLTSSAHRAAAGSDTCNAELDARSCFSSFDVAIPCKLNWHLDGSLD